MINMRKTKLLPRKRRMLPTSGKLLVDNIAGIPNEGVVRVMSENKIYSYSGVVPTRKRRMKEKWVGEIKYHALPERRKLNDSFNDRMYELGVGEHDLDLKIKPNWHERVRINIFNWLACGVVKIDL